MTTDPSISTGPQKQDLRPSQWAPFDSIALAFSGGGFRAASFSLGVLSYLHQLGFEDHNQAGRRVRLLEKVTYMSAASGGSFATAMYALLSAQNRPFEKFYQQLYDGLEGEKLLREALQLLTGNKGWEERGIKNRNIINSFAMAYDRQLFNGATLGDLYPRGGSTTHLEEVCFNSTEFFRGLLFRQQIKMKPDAKDDPDFLYGNFIVRVDHQAARHIRLGDILAASSCFPAGFEPVIFPQDFTAPGISKEQLLAAMKVEEQTGDCKEKEFLEHPEIGLMDGGITDNQGLESMMTADERRIKGGTDFKSFDLMLVNDVGSHFMDPYTVPKTKKGKFTLNTTICLLGLIALAGLGGLILGLVKMSAWMTALGGIFFVLPALLVLLLCMLLRQLRGTTKPGSSFNLSSSFGQDVTNTLLRFLHRTTLRVLAQLVKTRASSILIMNNDVFLKRIRYLLYNKFYDSPQWMNRGKGNHVYDLSFTNNINRLGHPTPGMPDPSRAMQIVAENAYSIGTTLWFDKSCTEELHGLGCLVACGQFTTCYNLLEYIQRLEQDAEALAGLNEGYRMRISGLKQQLQADFERFNQDPFWLYNEFGKRLTGFQPHDMSMIPFPARFKCKEEEYRNK